MHYISLGEFCTPAIVVEELGLRTASYPFDWLYSTLKENVSMVSEMIHSKSIETVLKKYSTFLERQPNDLDRNEYHFAFPHGPVANTQEFNDTARRRIQRLYDIIHSTEEITFIFCNRNDKIDAKLLLDFIQIVQSINNKCKMIVLHGDIELICEHPSIFLKYYPFPNCPNSDIGLNDRLHRDWLKNNMIS